MLLGPARGLRIRKAFGLQCRRVLSFRRQPMWPPVCPTRMSYTIFSLGKAHGNDWKHDREAVKWEYNREAVNTDESPRRSETPFLGCTLSSRIYALSLRHAQAGVSA